MVSTLVLLWAAAFVSPAAAADGIVLKDAKGLCQIEAPSDWSPLGQSGGAAIFHDPSTAIAVVTSQPGQEFKPFTAAFLKTMGVAKDKMFENSATRIFYQDRTAADRDDQSSYSSSVPAKGGTCSCRVAFAKTVPEEIVRKIVLSLTATTPKT